MSGLLVGGVATELLGWRWVFLVMVPPAVAVAALAPRTLPEVGAQRAGRPDVLGAVLVTAALMAILLGITGVERAGPVAAATIVPVLAGAGLLAAFVAWERRAPAPLLRFRILRVASLRGAALGVAVNAIAFTSVVYVGTLYLQAALDYGPIAAGLALLPLDAVALAVPLLTSRRIARRSPRAVLSWSFACTALALLWLARTPVPAGHPATAARPRRLALGRVRRPHARGRRRRRARREGRRVGDLRDRQPSRRRRGRRCALRHGADRCRLERPRR